MQRPTHMPDDGRDGRMTSAWTRETPIGPLTLTEEAGALTGVLFGPHAPQDALLTETPLILRAFAQLEEYFRGERPGFDLPLDARGTPFQRRCWQALLEIPYGQTRTYAQQAQAVGSPRACRAVGIATHRNPLPILIPCHRVVGADGSLTGYAGGLGIKEKLLEIEQSRKG